MLALIVLSVLSLKAALEVPLGIQGSEELKAKQLPAGIIKMDASPVWLF